jgi:hypothetical protein
MSVIQTKNTMFAVDAKPALDTSIEQVIYRTYTSDTTLQTTSNEVIISVRDVNEFFSLKRSYLEIEGVFEDLAGSGSLSSVDSKVALESQGVVSCFSQSRLRVQNILVEDNQSLSHVNAHVKRMTTKSRESLETKGRSSGAAQDNTIETSEDPATLYTTQNLGLVKRRQDAGGVVNAAYASTTGVRKVFTLPLSDLFSCCEVDKVMKGVSLKIELGLRQGLERVFSITNLDTFNLKKVDLQLAMVQPSLAILGELEGRFSKGDMISYVYPSFKTYESPAVLAPTSMSYTFNVQSSMPLSAFVGVQQTQGSTSNYWNSAFYDRANVTELLVKLNGKIFPYERYNVDWNDGKWMGVYEQLSRFREKYAMDNSGLSMTPEVFFKTFPVYYIDFSTVTPASSYQISVESRHSSAPDPINIPAVNSRSNSCKFMLTVVSLAELTVQPNNGTPMVLSS